MPIVAVVIFVGALVTQRIEYRPSKPRVTGSNPVGGATLQCMFPFSSNSDQPCTGLFFGRKKPDWLIVVTAKSQSTKSAHRREENEMHEVIEKRSVEREYGFDGTQAIINKDGNKILIADGFGGVGDLCGGAVRWRHGMAIRLKSDDTFAALDADYNVYFSILDRALEGADPDRPVLQLDGNHIEAIAKKAGL